MRLIYQGKECQAQFPDDTKYFKLSRKYRQDFKIEIEQNGVTFWTELKHLKCIGEVRCGRCNSHHINASSRGGQSVESNLLRLDISRHNAYHLLFGNLNFLEVAELLKRTWNIKQSTKGNFKL